MFKPFKYSPQSTHTKTLTDPQNSRCGSSQRPCQMACGPRSAAFAESKCQFKTREGHSCWRVEAPHVCRGICDFKQALPSPICYLSLCRSLTILHKLNAYCVVFMLGLSGLLVILIRKSNYSTIVAVNWLFFFFFLSFAPVTVISTGNILRYICRN